MSTVDRRQVCALLATTSLAGLTFPALRVHAECKDGSRELWLLNRKLVLEEMMRYEPAGQRFVPATLTTGGRPTLVHLWSITCKPCREEMAMLSALMASLRRESGLRVLFIAEDERPALESYFRAHFAALPDVEHYQINPSGRQRGDLQETTQPLTLLLDGSLVVRQAFVGQLEGRRNELLAAAGRLQRSLGRTP